MPHQQRNQTETETETMSFLSQATTLYHNAVAKGAKRDDVIATFMKELGISRSTATTYYQIVRARALKTPEQAAQERKLMRSMIVAAGSRGRR